MGVLKLYAAYIYYHNVIIVPQAALTAAAGCRHWAAPSGGASCCPGLVPCATPSSSSSLPATTTMVGWTPPVSTGQPPPATGEFLGARLEDQAIAIKRLQPPNSYAHADASPLRYNGSNPQLTPGTLLAVRPTRAAALQATMRTVPGARILATLTDYGGYLVDDTAANRGTMCIEGGVAEEFEAAYGFPFDARPGSPFYADLLAIFQALEIVVNSSPSTIGGGGSPLQPLAPPICQ